MNSEKTKKIFIVLGMAGSGKTTFCQRLYSWLSQEKLAIDKNTGLNSAIFSINLDPAVLTVKMPLNVDIRDTINFNNIMEEYNLGPNGAVATSLNLFFLEIDKLINSIAGDYVIIDTPGQIEAFTWSSPGFVLVECLKALKDYEIKILYIADSLQTQDHAVFMSNMVYAASIMCRYQVETLLVFNKIDLSGVDVLIEWINDYQKFRESLPEDEMNTPILSSMALHFEEFYNSIRTVAVSSLTGMGKKAFFEAINYSKKEKDIAEEVNKLNIK